MAKIGKPQIDEPLQVPAPWTYPEPVKEPSPAKPVPEKVPA